MVLQFKNTFNLRFRVSDAPIQPLAFGFFGAILPRGLVSWAVCQCDGTLEPTRIMSSHYFSSSDV